MNFLFPFFASILQASSSTLDKVLLSFRRIDYTVYTGISFPLLFIIALAIFLVVQPPFTHEFLRDDLFVLLLISVTLITITNLIAYRALDHDRLSEIEGIVLLQALPVILFSSLIFTDERHYGVIIPALVATGAIGWSHWEKSRFHIKKDTFPFLVWLFIAAPLGASITKELLRVWNPISLELVRSFLIAVILHRYFLRAFRKITFSTFSLFLLTNVLSSVAWILIAYSYQRVGIVHTILFFSLEPLLVYFASVFFLKERFHWKKFVAFIIVLASIVTAQLLSA